jgi:hypothetical protein
MREAHRVRGTEIRRGTEEAITAPTRNRMGAVMFHVGSNPTLSAKEEIFTVSRRELTQRSLLATLV